MPHRSAGRLLRDAVACHGVSDQARSASRISCTTCRAKSYLVPPDLMSLRSALEKAENHFMTSHEVSRPDLAALSQVPSVSWPAAQSCLATRIRNCPTVFVLPKQDISQKRPAGQLRACFSHNSGETLNRRTRAALSLGLSAAAFEDRWRVKPLRTRDTRPVTVENEAGRRVSCRLRCRLIPNACMHLPEPGRQVSKGQVRPYFHPGPKLAATQNRSRFAGGLGASTRVSPPHGTNPMCCLSVVLCLKLNPIMNLPNCPAKTGAMRFLRRLART